MSEHLEYTPEFEIGERKCANTTISEIFPGTREPDGLSLTTAPLTLTSEVFDGGVIYTAALDASLRGEEFSSFLNEISPVKPFGIRGILADWIMPDHSVYKELLRKHTQALGEEWLDFEEHRKAFLEAIGQRQDPEQIIMEIKSSVMTFDQAREHYLQRGNLSRKYQAFAKTRGDDVRFKKKRAEIVAFMTERQKESPVSKRKSPSELYAIFFDRYGNRNRAMFGDFFRENPEFVREEDIQRFMTGGNFRVLEGGSDPIFAREKRGWDQDQMLIERKKDSLEVRVLGIPRPLVLPIVEKEGKNEIVIDDGIVNDPALKPLLVWARMDGGFGPRRSLVTNSETASYYHNLGDEYNTLLGFLSLPYFDENLRKNWPTQVSLSKGGFRQDMRAAQVPVLALRYRGRFANSGILERAEEFVDTNGTFDEDAEDAA